ncbi:hypothetical protein LSH36_250g02042 [Paralvinella palmiformis]|uniref:Uncharacterized protein n=1 Tax=Paralvinella palmiformis TaxID=53620 RepID=A0AAD9N2T2_9ANNE|nr:hypothetical protein LSH36_250g02042 [Paralvinella palmiformis]
MTSTPTGCRFLWRHVIFVHVALLLACIIGSSRGETTASSNLDDDSLSDSNIPVALVTLVVLSVCIIIGLLIAKGVDHCYDRRAIRDDVSDISEFTKELLKAQFLYAFNKKLIGKVKSNETVKQRARRLGRIWAAKARKNLRERNLVLEELDQQPKDGATLVSVKVIGGAGNVEKKDAKKAENATGQSAPDEKSSNTNNNQGTIQNEFGTSTEIRDGADPGGPDKKGSKSPPGKRKNAKKGSKGKDKKTPGSPKRKKKVGNGKKKKKKAKKSQVNVSDGDRKRDHSDTSDSDSDSDSDADTDDATTSNNDANGPSTSSDTSHDIGPVGRSDKAHVASAPCRDKRRRPAATLKTEKETTGSECSSRDDYEFLANSARVGRRKKQPDEAWVSTTGSSPNRGRTSGSQSKLSMSVDSSLL